ncbi:MAG TPA: corrinoid protein [Flexilinea sp.]|nr:corrinoid protein [Flexilinea sp.]HPS47847.1 corrinoid protein [Flexilinea sp.]
MSDLLNEIKEAIIDGSAKIVSEKVTAALEEGFDPEQILNDAMIAGMAEVGQLFEDGEYFVPEMLVAARAMTTGMQILKPRLVQADVKAAGKVAIGTVQGDLHDIGKNLVGMMLEGASFEIIDLGADVPPEKFVEAVQKDHVQIVAMSALLTTTMPSMKTTIEALEAAGVRDQVKVMVGGAPLSDQYAKEIRADGYAPDANKAVALAKSLVS